MYGFLRIFCLAVAAGLISFSATAWSLSEYLSELGQNIKDTLNCGRPTAHIPVNAWHNRLAYDKKHIKKYNENPWGLGIGKYLYEGKDWHGVYAMVFEDSNRHAETFFGYAFIKNYSLDEADNWRAGIGYTLGITQRHEYHYIPIPAPLPIASLSYKNVSLNAAYVPGLKNNGNVLFSWIKIEF